MTHNVTMLIVNNDGIGADAPNCLTNTAICKSKRTFDATPALVALIIAALRILDDSSHSASF
jgi:hypothetical protein